MKVLYLPFSNLAILVEVIDREILCLNLLIFLSEFLPKSGDLLTLLDADLSVCTNAYLHIIKFNLRVDRLILQALDKLILVPDLFIFLFQNFSMLAHLCQDLSICPELTLGMEVVGEHPDSVLLVDLFFEILSHLLQFFDALGDFQEMRMGLRVLNVGNCLAAVVC